jgi:hypothetical protein
VRPKWRARRTAPVRRPAPDSGDFTSLPPEAVLPAPLHRRRCGFQTPTRLQDLDLACVPAPASGSQCSGRIGCLPAILAAHLGAIGDLPDIPERASSEVPGAVTPRAFRFRGSVQRLGHSPALAADPCQHGARVRRLSPRTGRRPAAVPLATARSRRITCHRYKGKEGALTVARWSGEKLGSRWSRRSRTSSRGLHARGLQPAKRHNLSRAPAAERDVDSGCSAQKTADRGDPLRQAPVARLFPLHFREEPEDARPRRLVLLPGRSGARRRCDSLGSPRTRRSRRPPARSQAASGRRRRWLLVGGMWYLRMRLAGSAVRGERRVTTRRRQTDSLYPQRRPLRPPTQVIAHRGQS